MSMESSSSSEGFLAKESSLESDGGPTAGQSSKQIHRSYSAADRAEFFAVLDRAGSIAVAAETVGILRTTGYYWAYKSGLITPTPRKKPAQAVRATTEEVKEFLTVLSQVGSISVAARQLGIPRARGAYWARCANIKSIHPAVPKRAEFLRLREAGTSRKQAAAKVGVSHTTAARWEQAWDEAQSRAVTPKKRALPYTKEVTSPKTVPAPLIPGEQADNDAKDLPGIEQVISSRYLCLSERLQIADLLQREESMRTISKALGRNVGTISREIARNSHPELGYLPNMAHRASVKARARPKEVGS